MRLAILKFDTRGPFIREEKDKSDLLIPIEYPVTFNAKGWCWPGFFFTDMWCFYKGIHMCAWKYIILGLISWTPISLCLSPAGLRIAEIIGSYIKLPDLLVASVATFLIIVFLILPLAGSFVNSVWCGLVGYRDYSRFINRYSSEKISLHKKIGLGFFILFLLWVVLEVIGFIAPETVGKAIWLWM